MPYIEARANGSSLALAGHLDQQGQSRSGNGAWPRRKLVLEQALDVEPCCPLRAARAYSCKQCQQRRQSQLMQSQVMHEVRRGRGEAGLVRGGNDENRPGRPLLVQP